MNNVYGIKLNNDSDNETYYKDFDNKKKSQFDTYRLDLKTIDGL